jgi:hypothetical protein
VSDTVAACFAELERSRWIRNFHHRAEVSTREHHGTGVWVRGAQGAGKHRSSGKISEAHQPNPSIRRNRSRGEHAGAPRPEQQGAQGSGRGARHTGCQGVFRLVIRHINESYRRDDLVAWIRTFGTWPATQVSSTDSHHEDRLLTNQSRCSRRLTRSVALLPLDRIRIRLQSGPEHFQPDCRWLACGTIKLNNPK